MDRKTANNVLFVTVKEVDLFLSYINPIVKVDGHHGTTNALCLVLCSQSQTLPFRECRRVKPLRQDKQHKLHHASEQASLVQSKDSFGVEFEFLIPYLYEHEKGQVDPSYYGALPSVTKDPIPACVLIPPNNADEREPNLAKRNNALVLRRVNNVLADHGFQESWLRQSQFCAEFDSPKSLLDGDGHVLEKMDIWHAVEESLEDPTARGLYPLKYAAIEVKSPTTWYDRHNLERSLKEIGEVLYLLRCYFPIRVNPRCGLHVHIGTGFADDFPEDAKVIQRFCAMVWAADGILSVLHPPERGANHWCPNIRQASLLAQTELPRAAQSHYVIFGNEGLSAVFGAKQRFSSRALASIQPSPITSRAATRNRQPARRFRNTRKNFKADRKASARVRLYAVTMNAMPETITADIISGCAALLACKTGGEAAALLSSHQGRLNYHVGKLAHPPPPSSDRTAAQVEQAALAVRPGMKPTIEFREAVGSVDAEWVRQWVQICAGLVRFAWASSDDEYYLVLARLAEAAGEPRDVSSEQLEQEQTGQARPPDATYDVVDFLDDIGLSAQADFVEKILPNPGTFWNPCANLTRLVQRAGHLNDGDIGNSEGYDSGDDRVDVGDSQSFDSGDEMVEL